MNEAPPRTGDDGIVRTPVRDWIGIALALACGLAATVWRYRFIDEHTLELLALVMRAADPNFLPKDFFTWSGSAFGPRTPLLTMLGLLARALPFDRLYLGLASLTNVGLALVSFAFARTLYDDRRAPRLAAVLVSAAPIPTLAGSATLSASAFEPQRLAFVLVLLGLYLSLVARRSAVRGLGAGVCASIATLVEPRLGLPSAVLLLVVLGVHTRPPALAGRVVARATALVVPAAALVVAPIFVHERVIADETFVAIVALHRHPELYTSGYVARAWANVVGLGSVVLVTMFAGREWLRSGRSGARELARAWLVLAVGVALLVLASWVFVERWPWRAWLLFTPLRTFNLLSWAALILAAGTLVERWTLPGRRWSAVLLMLGLSSVVLAGPMFVIVALLERWAVGRSVGVRRLVVLLVLLLVVILLFLQPPVTVALLLVAVALLGASERPLAFALALAVLAGAVALNRPALARRLALAPALETWLDANFRPRWRSRQFDDDALRLARDVRRYTPPTSVILTPPDFGSFRLIAERAIVVDFHGLPDHDRGVAEWAMRVFDCYGPPVAPGANALSAYRDHYDRLTDTELIELGARYHANFAVVSRASGSRLHALFESDGYELVVLPRPVIPGRVVKRR